MSESKHTKGPWNASKSSRSQGWSIYAEKLGIAYIFCSQDACPYDPAEAKANACLIAAAPKTAAERDKLKAINADLLGTCEMALSGLSTLTTSEYSRGKDKRIRDKLQTAITKATS